VPGIKFPFHNFTEINQGDFFMTWVSPNQAKQMVYLRSTSLYILNESVISKNQGPRDSVFRIVAESSIVDVSELVWVGI
jgi:hypothetical protein